MPFLREEKPVADMADDEPTALRKRIYAALAEEGGGNWAIYICMDIDRLIEAEIRQRAASLAGTEERRAR